MSEIEQENPQLENVLGEDTANQENSADMPQAVQLIQPKEVENEIIELEKQYRETVEKMNV